MVELESIDDKWIFPSHMAFAAWGPFTPANKRLPIFEIKDSVFSIVKSRVERRKKDNWKKIWLESRTRLISVDSPQINVFRLRQ